MLSDDEKFMRRAIELAERGRWRTAPNPTVGAVLVKEGRIVSEGWHEVCGQAHAEVNCLRNAAASNVDPAGSTLYVTLEPCNHYGKTPPCSKAVAEAGIRRVVMGMSDINPGASGGADFLRSRGIEVVSGVLEKDCRELVADFITWQLRDRPFVILKMAMTLDGKTAPKGGRSVPISCSESRKTVMQLRASIGLAGGAVLIGGNTFRLDDPLLTARDVPCECQPVAAVMTKRLPSLKDEYALLKKRASETVFLTSYEEASSVSADMLRSTGARVYGLPYDAGNVQLDAAQAVRILGKNVNCRYVLCEGGGRLAYSLLKAGFIDEFRLHVAPVVYGDDGASSVFSGADIRSASDAVRMRAIKTEMVGCDTHITLRPETEYI